MLLYEADKPCNLGDIEPSCEEIKAQSMSFACYGSSARDTASLNLRMAAESAPKVTTHYL